MSKVSTNNAVCMMTQALWSQTLSCEADMAEAAEALKENTEKREALRNLSDEVDRLENAISNCYNEEGEFVGSAQDRQAMESALSDLRNQLRDLGFDENSVVFQATIDPDADVDGAGNLIPGTGTFKSINENLDSYIAEIEDAIDQEMEALGDKGDQFQLDLQMASNERDRAFQTLSNVAKADHQTSMAIVGNIR